MTSSPRDPEVEDLDPLDGSTWKSSAERAPASTRTRLPCLTIVAHADLRRLGERALLTCLRVGEPALVSRLEPGFAPPSVPSDGRPLQDRYLSRSPFSIRRTTGTDLVLSSEGPRVVCDGIVLSGERVIRAESLKRGVLLELGDRVALLLHWSDGAVPSAVGGLLGASPLVERLRREIGCAAEFDVPVLIRGESGSGKERVARALHDHGPRSTGPYLAVNMATLSEAMAVSVLFGHARGAFTGATQDHRGLFERAHGGTLFLDEIGDTPAAVQPMLLRALESKSVRPLGEARERSVDVRIVAATDADLDRDIEQGAFRRALLHRLSAYEIRVPTLRDRREDILPLFAHFLRAEVHEDDAHCLEHQPGARRVPLSTSFVRALLDHPLPGNVRELRNIARRVAVASRAQSALSLDTTFERLQEAGSTGRDCMSPVPSDTPEGRSSPSDELLLETLERVGWSAGRASAHLGIPTSTVYDLMRRCPQVRKAKDVPTDELAEQLDAARGDVVCAARTLRVSERALRMTLRERGLLPAKR